MVVLSPLGATQRQPVPSELNVRHGAIPDEGERIVHNWAGLDICFMMEDRSANGRQVSWRGTEADEAFETLVRDHQRAVLNYCARRASRADAWDAASDVFLVAWRRFDELPDESEARAWLLGVAYKMLSNQRRAASRRVRLSERVANAATTATMLASEPFIDSPIDSTVLDALARLKPADREVLQMDLWDSLSREEIAQVLGISTEAVHKRFSRAKKRLGDELAKELKMTGRATQVTATKGGTP